MIDMLITILILIWWSGMGFIIILALSERIPWLDETEGFEFVNPFYVYKNVEVNYFGAVMIALGLSLCCPIGTIGYWFYKLCIVGRK